MEYPDCYIVYVDKRAAGDRYEASGGRDAPGPTTFRAETSGLFDEEVKEVQINLRTLLSVFSGVHVCTTGTACVAKIRELNASIADDCRPTLVILDVYTELEIKGLRAQREGSTPSPKTPKPHREMDSPDPEDFYSIQLLQHISNEIAYANYSKLIIPIAMTHNLEGYLAATDPRRSGRPNHHTPDSFSRLDAAIPQPEFDPNVHGPTAPIDPKRMMKCLEAGAVDVITSPLDEARVYGLVVHVHRAHKESVKDQAAFLATMRLRKRSWVGMDTEVPYAYLRESMVSHLMTSICKPESVLYAYDSRKLYIINYRQEVVITKAIGRWDFSAHDFSEDELVHAAFLMLQHALQLPDLEKWRMPADDLKTFLMACRAAYNNFVLYHNFRHVIDVLQAVFYFLLQIGVLPPYPGSSEAPQTGKPVSPVAALLKPFDALTLLISAIGHDVGHPGVNNAFLVALKAPLAQLYNDNSVLEAFHCAAYSQILRRYWPLAFEDTDLRKLLITSILATDMGLHFKYMADLGNLQSKLHDNNGTAGWSPQVLTEQKILILGLLIKCADISNVARPFPVASKWSDILQLEFARQGEMEKDIGMPTTLFGGPPELGNVTMLGTSQLNFMSVYAGPLFEAVTDILPGMQFAVDEISANRDVWKGKLEREKSKEHAQLDGAQYVPEGFQSPRSGSPDRFSFDPSPVSSHPEGLPASASTPSLPASPLNHTSLSDPGLERTESLALSPPAMAANAGSTVDSLDSSHRQSPVMLPIGPEDPTQETTPFSRRSSGASPAANTFSPVISTRRRSSNTAPSQLQISTGNASLDPFVASSENTQPGQHVADQSLFSGGPLSSGPANAMGRRPYGSASTGVSSGSGSGRGCTERDVAGDDPTPQPPRSTGQPYSISQSGRHSAQQSSGRYSAMSSQDRSSNATSGAHTLASHGPLNSPTETQATSFLTDGSSICDDGSSPAFGLPGPHSPSSGSRYPINSNGMYTNTSNDIKSSMNGHAVMVGLGEQHVIKKKNSRFLSFFKKRSREGSNTGSP